MFPVVASFARLRPKESPDEFLNATNVSKSFSGALQAFSPTTSKATFSQWAFDAPFARSLRKLYFCVSQLTDLYTQTRSTAFVLKRAFGV